MICEDQRPSGSYKVPLVNFILGQLCEDHSIMSIRTLVASLERESNMV